jgi:hypothetical protein
MIDNAELARWRDEERAREIAEHAGIDMMDDHDLFIREMSAALVAVRAEEREACAKVVDDSDWGSEGDGHPAPYIAAAIRARNP